LINCGYIFEAIQYFGVFNIVHNITCCFYSQEWRNDLLKWKPEDYNGIETVNIQRSQLWLPDTLIINEYKLSFSQFGAAEKLF